MNGQLNALLVDRVLARQKLFCILHAPTHIRTIIHTDEEEEEDAEEDSDDNEPGLNYLTKELGSVS